jgi:hypothetical protein
MKGERVISLKTKKTELFFVFQNSNGYALVKLGCPKGIQGLGGSKPQIDDTCLDSDEMEFTPGMPNPGALTVDLDFDPSKVSHQDLIYMDENDITATWIVALSDGIALPTVNSGTGVVTYPTTRTYINFQGYIADVPLDIAVNANVKSSVSIQRSGKRFFHFKA